jgi:S-adenosylmethionine uptake transporter
VFYFSVGTAAMGLIGVLFDGFTDWRTVSWQAGAWLLPIGVLASLGQWAMTRAYSRGPTLLVANLQYAGIVFAAFYSLLLFDEQIAPIAWIGMAVIVASGVAATVLRTRVLPNTPAEEH